MSEAANQPVAEASDTIDVTDLNQFVKLLAAWHDRKVTILEHFLKMEEGIEMQVGEEPSFKLEGDLLKGMKAGINLALMEFGTLPFACEFEPEDAPVPESTGV